MNLFSKIPSFFRPAIRWPLALFFAGLISALAQAPFYLVPLMALPYCLWLLALRENGQSRKRIFLLSFMAGFGIHLGGLYWIGNAMLVANSPFLWAYPFALAGLPALFGLYYGFAGLAFNRFCRKYRPDTISQWLAMACMVAGMEYVRGFLFTGYPWNLPAYIWLNTPVAQTLALIGPYALTLLTILLLTVPVLFIDADRKWNKTASNVRLTAVLAGLFLLMGLGGVYRLTATDAVMPNVRVMVVQPNIDQSEKWDSAKHEAHFARLLRLSQKRGPVAENITTLIVWPETALSGAMLNSEEAVARFRKMIAAHGPRTHLFSGTLRHDVNPDGSRAYYNSLLSWGTEALEPVTIYDKAHLVPFGEYMPFEKQLNLAPVVGFSGFQAGKGVATQRVPHAPAFSPLICYEVVFPHAVVDEQDRPLWLLNVTNDGWYGHSPGPYQHWDIVRARAIEEGLPAVRSANTGLSGVIDGYGRAIIKTSLGETRSITAPLPAALPATPYAQHGELFFAALLILVYGGAIIRCVKKAVKNPVP